MADIKKFYKESASRNVLSTMNFYPQFNLTENKREMCRLSILNFQLKPLTKLAKKLALEQPIMSGI